MTVTVVASPARAEVGLNEPTFGMTDVIAGVKIGVLTDPVGVSSTIGPATEPTGTAVMILVEDTTVNGADEPVPAKVTAETSARFTPVRVTDAPTPPDFGDIVDTPITWSVATSVTIGPPSALE